MKNTSYLGILVACFLYGGAALAEPQPTLIRGEVANPADYPATVWIGNCTASLVGPRVVLTAAHCINSSISFSVGPQRYTASCLYSREYRRNSTADYALCFTNQPVTGIPFEVVNTDDTHVQRGDEILLSGFGCTRWGTRLDGQYRVGIATVSRLPSGSNNDIVAGDGATLCSGDSGGPAWSLAADGSRDRLLSVNSRSDTRVTSYLSSWSTPEGRRFLEAAMNRFGSEATVCGITAGMTGCRGTGGGPNPPNAQFTLNHPVGTLEGTLAPGHEHKLDMAKRWLTGTLDDLLATP